MSQAMKNSRKQMAALYAGMDEGKEYLTQVLSSRSASFERDGAEQYVDELRESIEKCGGPDAGLAKALAGQVEQCADEIGAMINEGATIARSVLPSDFAQRRAAIHEDSKWLLSTLARRIVVELCATSPDLNESSLGYEVLLSDTDLVARVALEHYSDE